MRHQPHHNKIFRIIIIIFLFFHLGNDSHCSFPPAFPVSVKFNRINNPHRIHEEFYLISRCSGHPDYRHSCVLTERGLWKHYSVCVCVYSVFPIWVRTWCPHKGQFIFLHQFYPAGFIIDTCGDVHLSSHVTIHRSNADGNKGDWSAQPAWWQSRFWLLLLLLCENLKSSITIFC